MSATVLEGMRAFEIPLFSEVVINDRRHFAQHRLGDQWVFIDRQNERPTLLSDFEIGNLMSSGDLFVERIASGAKSDLVPRSPLLTSDSAHLANLRKHAYVEAVQKLGEHLRRSRSVLTPVIVEVAAGRGEKAPGFTTVLSWLDEADQFGQQFGTTAYSDRHDLKGRRGSKLPNWQEAAIQRGIENWLSVSRMTKSMAYAIACEAVREFDKTFGQSIDRTTLPPNLVASDGCLMPPSKRTFERRCGEVDRHTREFYKRGPHYAKNNNRTFSRRLRPVRPYEEVEVDHCTLDVIIVDESGCIFGRPDLVVFRDRATTMILGFSIGFEAPSYTSFLEGLQHTMYPKSAADLAGVINGWPCYGRIENLFVDNAFHLISENISEAGRELGFNIEKLPPRTPEFKGGLERLFRSMGIGLLHMLPGTSLEHVIARKDHEHLGSATLTLPELHGLITKWICDDFHQRVTKGLGFIEGHGGVPSHKWNELAAKCPAALLPNRDLFMSLAGDVDYRTIQRDGISWDVIKYEGAELSAVLSDPRHGVRREGRSSTKYKVIRDPYRLGEISLINHHTGEIIRVPATAAHQEYASSVTLHQHRVILAHANEKLGKSVDVGALMQVRAELADLVVRLLGRRPKTVQKKLARYIQTEVAHRLASRVITVPDPGASDFLGLDLPFVETSVPVTPSPRAESQGGVRSKSHDREPREVIPKIANTGLGSSAERPAETDDLEEFKKRKAWSVSDGRNS